MATVTSSVTTPAGSWVTTGGVGGCAMAGGVGVKEEVDQFKLWPAGAGCNKPDQEWRQDQARAM